MEKEGFVTYPEIVKILEDNDYRGFTVSRKGTNKYRTTFISVKWYTIDITVESLKLDGVRIVSGIEFNGEKLENYEAFTKRLRGISKEHRENRIKQVR
jgi:hypothetical protein